MAKPDEGKGSSETSFNVIIFPLSNVMDSPLDNLPKIGPGLSPKTDFFFFKRSNFLFWYIYIFNSFRNYFRCLFKKVLY